MTISEGTRKTLANIQVVRGRNYAEEQGIQQLEQRTPEEDWTINRNALPHHIKAGDWLAAMDVLIYLATREGHPDRFKALAHRVWLSLKAHIPVTEVTLGLSALQVVLGPTHRAYAPVAALAHLMAQRRTPDHPDRELARFQSQQMLQLAAEAAHILDGDDFQCWAAAQHLDDPDHFIPIVIDALEEIIEGDWWIDPDLVIEDDPAHSV